MQLKYRPEIDGLRAIAVLAVLLYHAQFLFGGVSPFKGGFIGVDVFFVISGYLITTIILRQLQEGNFSFSRFYERRARRILPALFTVMVATLPFAWLYMLPKAMKEYAGSVLSALAFGSNIWFWREDSYTAEPSALKPFLHTWTLSVEEQFYVLFPILLLLLWKYARPYIGSLFVLGLLFSLQLAEFGSYAHADATFYLLPTRGWELLAGAILAKLEIEKGRISHPFLTMTMPSLGLFLIMNAIFFFDDQMRHPSFITVLPIIGTMLLIWFCQRGELVNDVLSSRPFVAVGLISYSLYLWHFPIFAFTRIKHAAPSNHDMFNGLLLTIALAAVTYFLIEKPARNPHTLKKRLFFCLIGMGLCLLAGVQGYLYASNGAAWRLGALQSIFEHVALDSLVDEKGNSCWKNDSVVSCAFKSSAHHGNIVALGDSHNGYTLGHSLKRMADGLGRNYIDLGGNPGCGYVIGAYFYSPKESRKFHECNDKQAKRRDFLRHLEPSTLIIAARYPVILSGSYFDNQEGATEKGQSLVLLTHPEDSAGSPAVQKALRESLQELIEFGHTLVLVYPIPEVGFNVPDALSRELDRLPISGRLEAYRNLKLSTSLAVYSERAKSTFAIFDSLGPQDKVIRIYPSELFCKESAGRCLVKDDEGIYYADDDHLSPYGASLLVEDIRQKITQRESAAAQRK